MIIRKIIISIGIVLSIHSFSFGQGDNRLKKKIIGSVKVTSKSPDTSKLRNTILKSLDSVEKIEKANPLINYSNDNSEKTLYDDKSWITKDKFGIGINTLNALGSLATFLTFMLLFKKDKDKQNQIDKLANIATVLEGQTEVMRKQNDLLSQQVDIFRNTSILKSQDEESMKRLREIEEKKLKLSVMPNLWLNGAGVRGFEGELKVDLNNKGETAIFDSVILISGDIELHDNKTPFELEKGERRYIFGRTKGHRKISDCEYEIELKYKDVIGNKYISIIKGQGPNVNRIETKSE